MGGGHTAHGCFAGLIATFLQGTLLASVNPTAMKLEAKEFGQLLIKSVRPFRAGVRAEDALASCTSCAQLCKEITATDPTANLT